MSDTGRHILILGGGVVGMAATSVLLARSRRVSVTVLERSAIGEGASQYAGAMDIPYFRNRFQRELVTASWAWHETHNAGSNAYRHAVPMVWYSRTNCDLQSSMTTPLAEQPLDDAPAWCVPADTRVQYGPAFVIDSLLWCRSLASEVRKSGRCEVIENAEVASLAPDASGRLRVNCADGRCFVGDHVLLALGPWVLGWNQRLATWASKRQLRTKRVFGLNVEIRNGCGAALGWPDADFYLHPAPTGHSAGAYHLSLRHDEWDVDPDSPHQMVDEVLERCARLLDQLLGSGSWCMTGHRVFVDTYTPDFQAVVEPCTNFGADVTIATATHGSGVRMAPGIAELVADRVLSRLGQDRGNL